MNEMVTKELKQNAIGEYELAEGWPTYCHQTSVRCSVLHAAWGNQVKYCSNTRKRTRDPSVNLKRQVCEPTFEVV